MPSLLSRTSVTVDEAVGILLGLIGGPIEYHSFSDDDSPDELRYLESLTYCLRDDLHEIGEQLASDLADAKDNELDCTVIEARHEAVQKHAALCELATTYLCAINDELLKSEPALRVDRKLSSGLLTYITLTSLDEWAVTRTAGVQILAPLPEAIPSKPEATENKKAPKVRRKQRDQEEAIVEEMRRLGYNPLEYPDNDDGLAGVKSEVWATLIANELFISYGVFDKAWYRARKNGDIAGKK